MTGDNWFNDIEYNFNTEDCQISLIENIIIRNLNLIIIGLKCDKKLSSIVLSHSKKVEFVF